MSSPHDLATELLSDFRTQPRTPVPPLRTRPTPQALTALASPVRFAAGRREKSPLLTVLEQRRSVRFFSPDPIDAALVADVAARGVDTDTASWPAEQMHCPLHIDVVAFRLDGLEPGMYSLDTRATTEEAAEQTEERAYTQVARLPEPKGLHDLTIQREFCDSAAIISLAADLDLAGELHGAHGYRTLMGRASAAAYTMWLDAVAVGLVGTVFAGFIPSSVRQPLGSDGASRHQLFALALGCAPVSPTHRPPGPTGHG
ncbi:hypothetical protein SMCF_8263 [Streptomyces coelicoflavus ZG0656]|nr:hypothetical protein SMCF_8263 [Streptomyces coelicoflavus ZG0656]MZE43542.1 hypothetical protein [Streptomyces sp. SID5477]